MKTLSLKLSDALDRQLAATVARRGVKKSDVVREALEAYLSRTEIAETGSILALAGELVGCVDGSPDLSTNPVYLENLGR